MSELWHRLTDYILSCKISPLEVQRLPEAIFGQSKHGTIFEESPIPLNKWLAAMWLITGAKNGISSYEIHRALV